MRIKDVIYEKEEQYLSPFATKSKNTKGRVREEDECPTRTDFQRDKDRIVYSKAFMRLKNKTQVFFSPEGDHYRTRLTHTLNVSQVARSIARALSLNEDLTEAIALGHDLGHTPFGHAGERILARLNPNGFLHNVQSKRVVEFLEKEGKGLNLTREVVDGIVNHKSGLTPKTLEGMAVNIADRIAYVNHDTDDAISGGFITYEDLPKSTKNILGATSSKRINVMIMAIVSKSQNQNFVKMEEKVQSATQELRDFLFERVYKNKTFKDEEERADRMLSALYEYYKKNLNKLPEFYYKELQDTDEDTVICDYLSSMSDGYAISAFKSLFVPKTWKL